MFKNDWFSWAYDGVTYGTKNSPFAIWDISIKKTITSLANSFKEELLLNAKLIKDNSSLPLDILFSGGLDSEIVIRCYHELQIPVNIFIFKYENDYNIRDYTSAIRICNELNLNYKVIDFNLKKFVENDAYDYWKMTYAGNIGRLTGMKMTEYLDNTPVICDGIIASGNQVKTVNGTWKIIFMELESHDTCYFKNSGREVIPNWFDYSPEVTVSFLNLDVIKDLFNKVDYTHINSISNFKYFLYKNNIFSDIVIREKLTGYEGLMPAGLDSSKPDFMIDFNKKYIIGNVSNRRFEFSKESLIEQM